MHSLLPKDNLFKNILRIWDTGYLEGISYACNIHFPTLCVGATMAYAIRSSNYELVKLVCVFFFFQRNVVIFHFYSSKTQKSFVFYLTKQALQSDISAR